jgi:CheY-like chemotaxis protein
MGNSASILVVEDEDIMREALVDWFSSQGHRVAGVENGTLALEKISLENYESMILDLRMPGMDGLAVLKEVRANKPAVKVIIVTAYPSVETAVEAMRAGAVDYLAKPFEMERLAESLDRLPGAVTPEILRPARVEKELRTPCIWMQAGVVKKRECTMGYQCTDGCKFHAAMLRSADRWKDNSRLASLLEKVASVRAKYQCRYAAGGPISFRFCSNLYECETCAFAQSIEDGSS